VARLVGNRLAKASDVMLDGLADHLAATRTSDSKGTST
jgi:hypothetical protein